MACLFDAPLGKGVAISHTHTHTHTTSRRDGDDVLLIVGCWSSCFSYVLREAPYDSMGEGRVLPTSHFAGPLQRHEGIYSGLGHILFFFFSSSKATIVRRETLLRSECHPLSPASPACHRHIVKVMYLIAAGYLALL